MNERGMILIGGGAVLSVLLDYMLGIHQSWALAIHTTFTMVWAVAMYAYVKRQKTSSVTH